jgi:two-component system, LytTR family, sensor histidine kinase AlgZ
MRQSNNNITKVTAQPSANKGFFLPDFCHARSVFLVILTSQLLALVLALVSFGEQSFWKQLSNYSIIILWIALLSTGLLCYLKPSLRALSDLKAGIVSYLLILVVTLLVTVVAHYFELFFTTNHSIDILMLLSSDRLLANLLIASILAGVCLRFFYLQAQYRRRLTIAADAKLQALQAKIQPHFLFNSMNIIASLISVKPELAEQAVEDLSDLFRASLADHDKQISLAREVELCQRYLAIEQLRLAERLTVNWQVAVDLNQLTIPPLTLQPLVENAIYHGIQPLEQGGTLNISIVQDNDLCHIKITNPVPDASVSEAKTSGHNMALANISERMQMLYGNQAQLVTHKKGQQFEVHLILPAKDHPREQA